ncbi:MAG: acyltransferase, partial [Mesorhizobium sp.]
IFRGLALASGLLTDTGWLSLAVLLVSVVSPVILYFIVKRTGFGNFLFERPAWAHIDRPSAAKASEKAMVRPAREAA